MPSERYLEILVSRSPAVVFGVGFRVVAQQLTLPSGRVDLLLEDGSGRKHIVELKKDEAKVEAINQVHRYLIDFRNLHSGQVDAWVVANAINPVAQVYAETLGIRTLSIPESNYPRIMREAKLNLEDLYGERVSPGVLMGGGVQKFKKNNVELENALSLLPDTARNVVAALKKFPKVSFEAGKLQVVVLFNGIKVGGINHLHCYISSNIVLDAADSKILLDNSFARVAKTQAKSSHVHVYWKSNLRNLSGIESVYEHFFAVVEKRIFSR